MPIYTANSQQYYQTQDASQTIVIDLLKQDLSVMAWGVAAVIPGILTLADKLSTLKEGTIVPGFMVFYGVSQMAFIAVIGVTLWSYWKTSMGIEMAQGNRLTILSMRTITEDAIRLGLNQLDQAQEKLWEAHASRIRNISELKFEKRDLMRMMQQIFLVIGYAAFAILILGHR